MNVWPNMLTDLTLPLHHAYGYDFLWPLPWLVQHPAAKEAETLRHLLTDPLLRALHDYPEATLIIDESPDKRAMPKNTDILQFLKTYPDVKPLLLDYKIVKNINICTVDITSGCAFTIWQR